MTTAATDAPTLWAVLNAHPASRELTDLVLRYRKGTWEAKATIVGGAGGEATGPVRDAVLASALEGAACMARADREPKKLPGGVSPADTPFSFDRGWTYEGTARPATSGPGSVVELMASDGSMHRAAVWFNWQRGTSYPPGSDGAVIYRGFARLSKEPATDLTGPIVQYAWIDRAPGAHDRLDAALAEDVD